MDAIKMLFGWILAILALLVAIQFLAAPIYDSEAAANVSEILDWLIAIGVIAAVVFGYLRLSGGGDSDAKSARRELTISVVLALLFLEGWFGGTLFGSSSGSARDLIGIIVTVMFVAVSGNVGLRLLRS